LAGITPDWSYGPTEHQKLWELEEQLSEQAYVNIKELVIVTLSVWFL
jgi:hypothetical protein